jgi:DNA-binding response OmpR family regulator
MPFEVLLSDIGLPDGDAFQLVAEAKRSLPVMKTVALTGRATNEDRELSRQAGFDHFLTKPVDFHELRSLLQGRAWHPRETEIRSRKSVISRDIRRSLDVARVQRSHPKIDSTSQISPWSSYRPSMVPRQLGLPHKHSYSFFDASVIGSPISKA